MTVLFADLRGSLESWPTAIPKRRVRSSDSVLERMMELSLLRRHRQPGDGGRIMALFGAPLAPRRSRGGACYAALRMQESVKRYAKTSWMHGTEPQSGWA